MTGLIPPGPLAYEGQLVVSYVARREDPTTAFINFNVPTIWINTANGNIWMLVGKALGIANWVLLGTGTSGPTIGFNVPLGSSPVYPVNGTGLLTFTSSLGTISITGSANSINFDLVGGATAIEKFLVQSANSPGVTTVTPSSGQVTINGAAVANAAIPVQSISRALHAYNIEVQYATSAASTTANKSGIAHFDSAYFTVDANGFVSAGPALIYQDYSNLGISYNAGTGTFSITSANGTALSANNPAYIRLPGIATPGTSKVYTLTANQTFLDHNAGGSSQIIGNLFGFTTSVAIAVDVPFFIYAVPNSSETTVAFMIGRTPHKQVAPAAGNIGVAGTPGSGSQTDLYSLPSITTSAYAGSPCLCLGSFRMQMNSSNDWTVQTIASTDGIGEFNTTTRFTIPLGQFGANASTLTRNNGGTAPTWSSTTGTYLIKKDGISWINIILSGDAGGAGSGSVIGQIITPYLSDQQTFASGIGTIAGGASTNFVIFVPNNGNALEWAASGASYINWSSYTAGARTFNASFGYTTAA